MTHYDESEGRLELFLTARGSLNLELFAHESRGFLVYITGGMGSYNKYAMCVVCEMSFDSVKCHLTV